MRYHRGTADDEDDSETSWDDGKDADKADRSKRRGRPGRRARFVDSGETPPFSHPNITARVQLQRSSVPPPIPPRPSVQTSVTEQRVCGTSLLGKVPKLATMNEGDVPGPFDLLPRRPG
jgi:hypothetical protein